MITAAHRRSQLEGRIGPGMTGAVLLHLALAAALVGSAFLPHRSPEKWGGPVAEQGSIQASMVSALPLPPRAAPVKESVLTSEDVTPAPKPPPPKEAAAPPPKPTDVLVKAKTPEKPPKVAPKPNVAPPPVKAVTKPTPTAPTVTPVRRPQPVPDTPKATSGEAATQFPQSVTQTRNGSAAATIEDRAFGARFAYYRDLISRTVSQNWYTAEADPRASQGRHVVVSLVIDREGSISDIKVESRSGSPSLDTSALRALQRIESFPPLPAGDHVPVQLSFDYHQP